MISVAGSSPTRQKIQSRGMLSLFPAWLDEDSADLLNLPEGSSYFPEWKPDELLRLDEAEIRANNGGKYWQALYMQNPTPDEGSAIKSPTGSRTGTKKTRQSVTLSFKPMTLPSPPGAPLTTL